MSFSKKTETPRGLIFYSRLSKYSEVLHFTTTKDNTSDNTALFTGSSPGIYERDRQLLAEKLGLEEGQLVFPRQTHSNRVAVISKVPEKELTGIDALVTNRTGICLCVQTADCVPVLLYDPVEKVVAAVHAGWRGTVGKIVSEAVKIMVNQFNSSPGKLIACIGPSIGPEVYEIGPEVVQQVEANIPNPESVFKKTGDGKALLNLWEANKILLLNESIPEQNITISGLCTYTGDRLFYSARRDGLHTGRMVSGIMLKE